MHYEAAKLLRKQKYQGFTRVSTALFELLVGFNLVFNHSLILSTIIHHDDHTNQLMWVY